MKISFVHSLKPPPVPLCFYLPLPSLPLPCFLCNRSSSAHFKPKHVCLAPKQTRPPLSPLLILLPLPHQTPFPIQRDDVMPMLRKTRGAQDVVCVCVCVRACGCVCVCVCVCACAWVWVEGSHGIRGHVSGRLSDCFLNFPTVISQSDPMRERQ